MAFLKGILVILIERLTGKAFQFFKEKVLKELKRRREAKKNKEAIEELKKAKTEKEKGEAIEEVTRRTFDD